MPAIGNIVVNDGAATPVAHTFAPVTTNGTVAELANRTATTPKGFENLQLSLAKPAGPTQAYKFRAGFYDPVEATVDGAVTVVRNNSADIRINFAPDSTSQERLDTLAMMANLLAHATVKSMVQNVEPIY